MASTAADAREPLAARRRAPLFYGWWIVLAGFVVMTLNGALLFQAFGAYAVLLREEFGWSRTALSLAFSLQRVESGLLGPLEGWCVDRFGPRRMMLIGISIFGGGFFVLSQVHNLAMFYAAFLIMALGAALGSFLPASVAIVNWFARRRSLALAVMSLGIAAGGLVQPIVVLGLEQLGWRTMSALSGAIMLAVGLPLAMLVRHHPEDHGWRPDGDPADSAAAIDPAAAASDAAPTRSARTAEVNFTPRQALRTRAFWMIGIGHGLSLLITGAILVHFVAYVDEDLGYSKLTAATMITLMTSLQVVGQLTGGYLGDRFNKQFLIIVAMLLSAAGMLVLAGAQSLWWVGLFAGLNGFGFGMRIPLTTSIRADYFGGRHYGTISGLQSMVITGGIIAGPLVAGAAYDATGSYVTAFASLGIAAGIGSLFFLFAQRPAPPADAEA